MADNNHNRRGGQRGAAARAWSISRRPPATCNTLGNADFIRRTLPGGEDDDVNVRHDSS